MSKDTRLFSTPKDNSVTLLIGSTPRKINGTGFSFADMLDRLLTSLRYGTPFEMYAEKQNNQSLIHIISSDDTYIMDEEDDGILTERVSDFSQEDFARAFLDSLLNDLQEWYWFEGLVATAEMDPNEIGAIQRARDDAKAKLFELKALLDDDKPYVLENKAQFTRMLNEALIVCGNGRYNYLQTDPLTYYKDGEREMVKTGRAVVSVNMDSLTAMMKDIARLFD